MRSTVGEILSGSWRRSPDALEFSEATFAELVPLLAGSMSGALAWWRVRNTPHLRASPPGLDLQETYRFHSIRTALREHTIKQVLRILSGEGVEPILVKGWAIARLYPEPGLRPYGDIDLVVRQEQYSSAVAVAKDIGGEYYVDVHDKVRHLNDHSFDDLFERSAIAKLDDVDVRILSPEDQLRVLSKHLWHHNAFRPLWLCDIAVAVENRAGDFDWDRCLGRNRRRADWVACAIGLAHELLGADVTGTPADRRAKRLPSWLVPNVLMEWETPYSVSQAPATYRAPMSKYLHDPTGFIKDLRQRWPKPIEATVYVGGPFNELPRWPFQVGECIARTAKFIGGLSSELRKGQSS